MVEANKSRKTRSRKARKSKAKEAFEVWVENERYILGDLDSTYVDLNEAKERALELFPKAVLDKDIFGSSSIVFWIEDKEGHTLGAIKRKKEE